MREINKLNMTLRIEKGYEKINKKKKKSLNITNALFDWCC